MSAGFGGALSGGPFFSTLLVLNPTGTPPYSIRGLSEKLQPIVGSAQLERDVNGTLVNLSPAQFRKYRIVLSCTDGNAPAFDGLWPGDQVIVDCAGELSFATAVKGGPGRDVVPGSLRIDGSFTFYRPRFTCLVAAPWSRGFSEWQAEMSWDLTLEEV